MTYQRGDIVLIPYPYTDLSGTKKRPVILLTEADQFGNHIVAKITSVLRNDPFAFLLNDQDLSVAFYRLSEVRTNELFTVSDTLIIKQISALTQLATRDLLDQIITNFQ
jgi:mRNA interferase MazF